jgi:hypothetical protein
MELFGMCVHVRCETKCGPQALCLGRVESCRPHYPPERSEHHPDTHSPSLALCSLRRSVIVVSCCSNYPLESWAGGSFFSCLQEQGRNGCRSQMHASRLLLLHLPAAGVRKPTHREQRHNHVKSETQNDVEIMSF